MIIVQLTQLNIMYNMTRTCICICHDILYTVVIVTQQQHMNILQRVHIQVQISPINVVKIL